MKIYIFILYLLMLFAVSKGQNVDSLKAISNDELGFRKGNTLKQIGYIYKNNNELDSAILYMLESLYYLNSIEDRCDIYENIGMSYFYKNDFLRTLENFKISLKYAKEIAKDSLIARRYSDIGVAYDYMGVYDKSVEYYYKALTVFERNSDKIGMSKIYNNLGIISQNRADAKGALELYQKSLNIKREIGANKIDIASSYLNIGSLYEELKAYPKSLNFYNKSLKIFKENNKLKYLSLVLSNIAGVKFYIGETDSANYYNDNSLKINDSINNRLGLINNFRLKANILQKMNKYDRSIVNYNKALFFADTLNVLSEKLKVLSDLVIAYKDQANYTKAFFYQEELIRIKDILSSEKTINKIETLEIVYETEKKEQEILVLQKNIRRNHVFQGIGAFILLLISLIVYLFFRNKLAQSKYEADLFNQKLLRLQMNPHFIFNTLASIQSYMFEKDTKQAALYLSSFSKLTRAILNNSREELISLQEDIETSENYLKIQQMRFENSFDYEIIVDPKIDIENVQVAPMLIQPFVENSVVHGFKDILHHGKLRIEYKKREGFIEVVIEDNGKGIDVQENKLHKSHALNITKERLKILNKNKKQKISFQIINLNNKGVKVVFSIPLIS